MPMPMSLCASLPRVRNCSGPMAPGWWTLLPLGYGPCARQECRRSDGIPPDQQEAPDAAFLAMRNTWPAFGKAPISFNVIQSRANRSHQAERAFIGGGQVMAITLWEGGTGLLSPAGTALFRGAR